MKISKGPRKETGGKAPGVQTTLYDLIAADQDTAPKGKEEIAAAVVVHLFNRGVIKFQRLRILPLIPEEAKERKGGGHGPAEKTPSLKISGKGGMSCLKDFFLFG